ncbi:MAG: YkgJ family cysteine cluster protein, partial [Elusimicrobia bacterium]|nr:YkgJ family cysteine cluster protein [Elusimicrobiota bacterium]
MTVLGSEQGMWEELPSVVTSSECLQCRGCCLFDSTDSVWRPRCLSFERTTLHRSLPSPGLFQGQFVSAVPYDAGVCCGLLDTDGHKCRTYDQRPLECRLYPFLLSFQKGVLWVCAHEACP